MLFASCISTRNVPALDNYGQICFVIIGLRSDFKKKMKPLSE